MAKRLPNQPPKRRPERRVREAIGFLLLACACGAAAQKADAPARHAAPRAEPTTDERVPASGALEGAPRFDGLSSRATTLAPGMREVARSEGVSERVVILPAGRRDACLRAAFEASAPIVARLVNARGNVLATTQAAAKQGVLGERGPVCVRKGDTVSVVVEPAGTQVRWLAWAAGT